MQTRTEIIVKGEVQRLGYRDVVERTARKMKLTGFVENMKLYDVRIICEGDKTILNSFIEQIRIKEYPVDVEHLDVSFQDATGEFNYFEIKRGDMVEELGERLDIFNAKITQLVQKQVEMIEKMDYNTSILKENTSILKNNNSILKENTYILKEFKHETGENLSSLTNIMEKHDNDAQKRITSLTVEISEIKERLSRVESSIS